MSFISSQLVTGQQWCWWGSIKIQMAWQEFSEQLYPDDWAKIETLMLKVMCGTPCRRAGCLMFWPRKGPQYQRSVTADRLTSSLLVLIKCTRGLQISNPRRDGCTSQITILLLWDWRLHTSNGVSKRPYRPAANACHKGDSRWSKLQKVITDIQTSEGKLCDLGKQNDSLPFPLVSLKTNLQRW